MIKHKNRNVQLIVTQVKNVIINEQVFFLESFGAQLIISGATRPNV